MKLKFYTDLSLFDIDSIEKNVFDLHHTYFFVSLLPLNLKQKFLSKINDESKSTFNSILEIKEEFVSDIDSCDYALLPPFGFWDEFFTFIKKHKDYIEYCTVKHNKKIVLFYAGTDDRSPINLKSDNFILFRCGAYKSEHEKHIYGIPTFCKDHYQGNILNKKLSLSFCGFPKNNRIREYFINNLSQLNYSDFINRDYWCDLKSYYIGFDSYQVCAPLKSKKEFIDNLEKNLYSIAIRGDQNYSHRLNEIFMMGRIPVLFDTDCILPFEDLIDYKKHTVYIKKENCPDFTYVDKLIREHYNSHSEKELMNLQKENRKLWENYFTVKSAFNKTIELLS